jgi:hypothetical protein
VKELAKQVMLSIEQNSDIFPSCDLGGYLLQTTGIPFLFVRNDTLVDKGNGVRYGFVDLTVIRKKLLFEAMRKREQVSHIQNMFTGAGMLATVGAVAWALKKVH